MPGIDESRVFVPLSIAVLTISDSRTLETDSSGAVLCERLQAAGHTLHQRSILPDDRAQIEAALRGLIADAAAHVVLLTGGTGVTGRDVTPDPPSVR